MRDAVGLANHHQGVERAMIPAVGLAELQGLSPRPVSSFPVIGLSLIAHEPWTERTEIAARSPPGNAVQ